MKRIAFFASSFIAGILLISAYSCKDKNEIDYSVMHVYQPQELQKIIDNAFKIEMIGKPTVTRNQIPGDSSTITTTTQIYRVYVGLNKEDHILPPAEVTESARQAAGPIIITSSCQMTCTPVRPGETCNVSGCMPTDKCGCTQGSCGNNCTTDMMCSQGLAGFGFGRLIIF